MYQTCACGKSSSKSSEVCFANVLVSIAKPATSPVSARRKVASPSPSTCCQLSHKQSHLWQPFSSSKRCPCLIRGKGFSSMCAHSDDHALHVDVHEMADRNARQDRHAVEHALRWLSLQRFGCCLSSSKYHFPQTKCSSHCSSALMPVCCARSQRPKS